MTDDISRRRRSFLRLLAAAGGTGLAGCSSFRGDSQPTGTADGTEQIGPDESGSAGRPTTGSRDQTPPEINTFTVEDWPGTTVDSRALYLSGTVKDESGLGSVTASLVDGASTTDQLDGETYSPFNLTLPISGGRSYTGTLEVSDDSPAGNTRSRTFDTDEVPPATPALTHDKLIGAHYYSWYGPDRHWPEGYANTPVLGEYDSTNTHVINQHIQWARQYGINWFSASWWGPEDQTALVLNDRIQKANLGSEIDISILYEPSRLTGGADGVDLDDPATRTRFLQDMNHLESTYFGEDNYLHVDGRPVVFLYSVNGMQGDLVGLLDEVRDNLANPPYVIGDIIANVEPSGWHLDRIDALDAITRYNPYGLRDSDTTAEFDPFVDHVEDVYRQWYFTARSLDTTFVPTMLPGYDKTESSRGGPNELLPRSTQAFGEFVREFRGLMEPDLDATLITSFNEWHEGTTLEPAEEYGNSYLEVVADELATATPEYWARAHVPIELSFNRVLVPNQHEEFDSPDDRKLAIRLFRLVFVDDAGDVVAEYDVGAEDEEPVFAYGAFGAANQPSRDPSTWRWLGGGREETVLYCAPRIAEASELRLFASPILEHEIRASVTIDGDEQGVIEFGENTEYRISLT